MKIINLSISRETKDILSNIHTACKYKLPKARDGNPTKGLVICDEADSLNSEGQEILRRCIERYGDKWWFVLIMNNPTRINPTLKSITKMIRFRPCENAKQYVKNVCDKQQIIIQEHELDEMDRTFRSDLRKMINAVQGLSKTNVRQEWQLDIERANVSLRAALNTPNITNIRDFVLCCGNSIRIVDVIVRTLDIGTEEPILVRFLESTLRSGNMIPHVAVLIHGLRKTKHFKDL